ncbi:hypothetical protein WJ972_35190 [Achromobacter insuavis]
MPPDVNFADRDFFQVHRERADAGMYISRPYQSRLRGGDESIGISRRLSHPDGSFAGVVSGSLRLAYFRERFAGLSIGPRDAITIFATTARSSRARRIPRVIWATTSATPWISSNS